MKKYKLKESIDITSDAVEPKHPQYSSQPSSTYLDLTTELVFCRKLSSKYASERVDSFRGIENEFSRKQII